MQMVQKSEKSLQPLRKAEKISSAERKARQFRTTRFCQFIQVIRTGILEIGPICTSCRNPCPNYPIGTQCLIRYPKHFSFPPLESIVNLYTLRGCLTKNPSLSPMSLAGHFQDPFVFYEARISRSRLRVAHFAFRVSDLLIHEKVKLLRLHRALSDCYGRIRTESRPIAWNRFNRSVGGKQR